jgi:malonyl CoA-acyl carrier protein transacylase
MKQNSNDTKIFINPSGFIEQHYFGELDPKSILDALTQLRTYAKKLNSEDKRVLILEDVSKITKIEFLSPKMAEVRKEAAKALKNIKFERVALYGPLHLQVILTTLALIAGKRNKVQVFDNRTAAIKWLLSSK